MSASTQAYKDRQFLAVIGDEDSVTGLLLAGIGHVTDDGEKKKNFFVVDGKTENDAIERAFEEYTTTRKDIAVLLINQHVCILSWTMNSLVFLFFFFFWIGKKPTCNWAYFANSFVQVADKIRARVDTYTQAFPAILEIPSKDHPYGMYSSAVCFNYISIAFNDSVFLFYYLFYYANTNFAVCY